MKIILLLLFSIFILFSLQESFYRKKNNIIVWTILITFVIILALIAAFRPSYMPDYKSYYRIFLYPDYKGQERIEIGFLWLVKYIKNFCLDFKLFLFISAFLSISLKVLCIRKLSPYIWCSMLVYLSSKYIAQDLIQMRAAFSAGLLLWAFYFKLKNNLFGFLFSVAFAFLFHYSSIAILLIWFFDTARIKPNIYIFLILFSYIIAYLGISFSFLIKYIPFAGIQNLYMHYTQIKENYNLFSLIFLFKVSIGLLFLKNSKRLSESCPYYVLAIKVYSLGLFCYLLLFSISTLASRLAELLQVVEVLLIPLIIFLFNKRPLLGKGIVILISAIYLFFYIYILKYFDI